MHRYKTWSLAECVCTHSSVLSTTWRNVSFGRAQIYLSLVTHHQDNSKPRYKPQALPLHPFVSTIYSLYLKQGQECEDHDSKPFEGPIRWAGRRLYFLEHNKEVTLMYKSGHTWKTIWRHIYNIHCKKQTCNIFSQMWLQIRISREGLPYPSSIDDFF